MRLAATPPSLYALSSFITDATLIPVCAETSDSLPPRSIARLVPITIAAVNAAVAAAAPMAAVFPYWFSDARAFDSPLVMLSFTDNSA